MVATLLGHLDVSDRVVQAFRDGSTAVLLVGRSGVGKRTVAAHVVSCLFEDDSASDCAVWAAPADGASSLGVDAIRSLLECTQQTPSGAFRLVVISQADTLTDEAADACLKALEEGTGRTRFLLLSSEPVRPTIQSRCEVVTLLPLPDSVVRQILVDLGVPAKKLDAAVSGALGLPGRGLRIADASLPALRKKAFEVIRAAVRAPLYEIPGVLDPVGDELLVDLTAEALDMLVDSVRCKVLGPGAVHGSDVLGELMPLYELYGADGAAIAIERLAELYRVSGVPLQFRYHLTVLLMSMRVQIKYGVRA